MRVTSTGFVTNCGGPQYQLVASISVGVVVGFELGAVVVATIDGDDDRESEGTPDGITEG